MTNCRSSRTYGSFYTACSEVYNDQEDESNPHAWVVRWDWPGRAAAPESREARQSSGELRTDDAGVLEFDIIPQIGDAESIQEYLVRTVRNVAAER